MGRLAVFFVLLAWAWPSYSRLDRSLCGSRPDLFEEERFLHRQALRGGRIRPLAAPRTGKVYDLGDIVIMEDADGVVSRRNEFNLDRRSLTFEPLAGAAKYRYTIGPEGYDAAAAGAGTPLNGLEDDDAREASLPFAFSFFGSTYRQVWINSDGNLTFTAPDTSSSERSLGRVAAGPPRIAPLFEDLDPSRSSGGVRVLADTGRFVVTWDGVPEYSDFGAGAQQTFQVRLYPDGRIEFAWRGIATGGAVVGISPGGLRGATTLVSFANDPSAEYDSTIGERFGGNLEIDVNTAVQRFYQTHEDAYDYLAIFNDLDIPSMTSAVAYEFTVRNSRTGYGDRTVEAGAEFGSAARLQAIMNMGPLSQYPASPDAVVSGRSPARDTPVTVLAHEAGHLFLAYASVPAPDDPRAKPMLGFQNAHWYFGFNSEASLLEGNRIQDNGPAATPRFLTTATVQGYSPLDQYLMGFRAPEEVEPEHAMFYVSGAPLSFLQRMPQPGVAFDGQRRDVRLDEIISAVGRRTPDHTVAQRRFRFAFILIVRQGDQPSADSLAKLNQFRERFEEFYNGKATGGRAVADTSLKLNLRLSVFPAAGVIAGRTATVTAAVDTAPAVPLEIVLDRRNGVASAPAVVTIPAGARSANFPLTGVRAGVEELLATPRDPRYHTAAARIQVAEPAGLRVVEVSRDPLVVRATDINGLPYPGVRLLAAASEGGRVSPASPVTDDDGKARLQWNPGPAAVNQLRVWVEGAGESALVLSAGSAVPQVASVLNAASYQPGIAPGSIATIFGANFGESARVSIAGRSASVLFANAGQINFVVPGDVRPGAATLVVANAQSASSPFPFTVSAVAPGIFAVRRAGNFLEVYCTGLGPVGAGDPPRTVLAVQAFIGARPAAVAYSGLAPGFQGLYQVNVELPAGLPSGVQTVTIAIGTARSNEIRFEN
ncbi:MAG: IPT/TIG domain-containing protein [Bryobacteraceae bacterium]